MSEESLKPFKSGAKVYWNWLGRKIDGHVLEVHFAPITKEIKGKSIKRNGSPTNPAYVVESEAGNLALKLHTELFTKEKSKTKSTPKMFS